MMSCYSNLLSCLFYTLNNVHEKFFNQGNGGLLQIFYKNEINKLTVSFRSNKRKSQI